MDIPDTRPLPGEPIDHAAELARLDRLSALLDTRFSVLGLRFGLDSLVGLVPGVGDAIVTLPSVYLIWRAHKLGLPRRALATMALNVAIDSTVGSIPLVGDVFDLFYKANRRNFRVVRRHLEASRSGAARPRIDAAGARPPAG